MTSQDQERVGQQRAQAGGSISSNADRHVVKGYEDEKRRQRIEEMNRNNGNASSGSGWTSGGRTTGSIGFIVVVIGVAFLAYQEIANQGAPAPADSGPRRSAPLAIPQAPPVAPASSTPPKRVDISDGAYAKRLRDFFSTAGMPEDQADTVTLLLERGLAAAPMDVARQTRVSSEDKTIQTFAMAAPQTAEGTYSALFCHSATGKITLKESKIIQAPMAVIPSLTDAKYVGANGTELNLSTKIADEEWNCDAVFQTLNRDYTDLAYVRGAVDTTPTMTSK